MNREDIIRMAREAGLMGNPLAYADWYPESLERFADLVSKHTLANIGPEEADGHAVNRREPLTDEQIEDIWNRYCDEMGEASINDALDIARAIESAHGIGE